jgi:hypothetical protein
MFPWCSKGFVSIPRNYLFLSLFRSKEFDRLVLSGILLVGFIRVKLFFRPLWDLLHNSIPQPPLCVRVLDILKIQLLYDHMTVLYLTATE